MVDANRTEPYWKWPSVQIGEAGCSFNQAESLSLYIISRQQALQNNLAPSLNLQFLKFVAGEITSPFANGLRFGECELPPRRVPKFPNGLSHFCGPLRSGSFSWSVQELMDMRKHLFWRSHNVRIARADA